MLYLLKCALNHLRQRSLHAIRFVNSYDSESSAKVPTSRKMIRRGLRKDLTIDKLVSSEPNWEETSMKTQLPGFLTAFVRHVISCETSSYTRPTINLILLSARPHTRELSIPQVQGPIDYFRLGAKVKKMLSICEVSS